MSLEMIKEYPDEEMYEVAACRPGLLTNLPTHYCPGCAHDTVLRMLAELIEELDIARRTTIVWPVGCAVFGSYYFTHKVGFTRDDFGGVDSVDAPHGRALAVATGIKRVQPDRMVITLQGDGDFASIGAAEAVHTFNRGENLTALFINNAIYGMTGGQMAPTTLPGQPSSTSPYGRNVGDTGGPIRMSEMLATLDGMLYAERVTMADAKHIRLTKRAIRRGMEYQLNGPEMGVSGTSLIEILLGCPTNWKMTPQEANTYVSEQMTAHFPLGVFKEPAKRKT